MKKFLCFVLLSITSAVTAQNVTENKLSFSYTQLPLTPLDKSTSKYKIAVERHFEKANEDSLLAYQARLEAAQIKYEAELADWQTKRDATLRDYFTKMAAWQKAVNAGETIQKPLAPLVPQKPIIDEVLEPQLHADIEDTKVDGFFNLQGYDKGEGGALVTVSINPIGNLKFDSKISGSGATTKYEYFVRYTMPVNIKVEDPFKGTVWQTILFNKTRTYSINTYGSQYEHDLWLIDNRENFWAKFESDVRNSTLKDVNKELNDNCGFPVYNHATEIYTVKRHKDHEHNDLVNAYSAAVQGYKLIAQELDHSAAESKLREAIKIWEIALTESKVNDNKARINDKITALIYCNIANAQIWLNEFDAADTNLNLALSLNINKFKRIANGLKATAERNKRRFNANK